MKSQDRPSDRPSRITLFALTTAVLVLVLASVLFAGDHAVPATFGTMPAALTSATATE